MKVVDEWMSRQEESARERRMKIEVKEKEEETVLEVGSFWHPLNLAFIIRLSPHKVRG